MMKVLHKVRRERPSSRPTPKHPTFKMQLQQEVERMEAGVGMQEDLRLFQRIRRLIQMMVWGLLRDRER